MKIHEYQAKTLFREYGVRVPRGEVASDVEGVRSLAARFGGTVAVKAQVHAGGRGKAGGIKVAQDPDGAAAAAAAILGMDIKGSVVRKVLVEEGADIAKEAYLGMILDRGAKEIGFILSAEGGVDIEEVAATAPDKILRFGTPRKTFPVDLARDGAASLFGSDTPVDAVLDIMEKLFRLFLEKDASLAEINPLVLTGSGEVIALDGKINFDDNALYRQEAVAALRDMGEENANELEAKRYGLSYVQLDGDIGCMVNGAGLAMATMDMIKLHGGQPANFLDVGGSSNPEKVVRAFDLILRKGGIKSILINIFGGITRCDDIARGILTSYEQMHIDVPVVVRLTGTNAEEGRALLANSSLLPAHTFTEAVQLAVAKAGGAA
jgi:succinyl-CoA synthetase beta subunit